MTHPISTRLIAALLCALLASVPATTSGQPVPDSYGPPQPYYAPPPAPYPYSPYPYQPTYRVELRPLESDPAALARYEALPRRPGAISLTIFGSLITTAGALTALAGAAYTDLETGVYYPANRPAVRAGVSLTLIGGVMFITGIARIIRRNAGRRELRRDGFYAPRRHAGLSLDTPYVPMLTEDGFILRF